MKLKLLQLWTVMILSIPLMVFSQTRQITGRITDQKGDAVPLASITVKGTKSGTAADENGRFSISVPGNNAVLVISSVGFQPQEVRVSNNYSVSVTLAGAVGLSEVVVTAMGISREKKALGYATQEIIAILSLEAVC